MLLQFLQTLFSSAVNQALPKNHTNLSSSRHFYRSANQAGRTVVIEQEKRPHQWQQSRSGWQV